MSAPVLWWVSWNDRTRNNPGSKPVQGVIAWWITGWAADDSYRTIVALVDSKTRRGLDLLLSTNFPSYDGPREWRFRRKMAPLFLDAKVLPRVRVINLGDRFPLSKWSLERLRSIGVCAMEHSS